MKNSWKTFLILSVFAVGFSSCGDDSNNPSPATMSQEEAAISIAQTLSTDILILSGNTNRLSLQAQSERRGSGKGKGDAERTQSCGVSRDSTFQRSYTGDYLNYTFSFAYEYTLNCNQFFVPQSIDLSYQSNGSSTLTAARQEASIMTTANSTGNFEITGILPNEDFYAITGNINSTSEIQQLTGDRISFSGNSSISNIQISIDKSNQMIASGSAKASIQGSGNNLDYSFAADISFNGDNTATITINGQEYTVDLPTGELLN